MVQSINIHFVERFIRFFQSVFLACHSSDACEAFLAFEVIHIEDVKLLEVALLKLVFIHAEILHPLLDSLGHHLELHRQQVLGVVDFDTSIGDLFVLCINGFLLSHEQFLDKLVLKELPLNVIRLPPCIQFLQLLES